MKKSPQKNQYPIDRNAQRDFLANQIKKLGYDPNDWEESER